MMVESAMHECAGFSWKPEEFGYLLRACQRDEGVRLALEYLTDKKARILEAGCGSGRVVKYLHDLGFENVKGIEIVPETVSWTNANFPELDIVAGDILSMPFERHSFDAVISFGVVEHFLSGPHRPLTAIRDALKPDGLAVVTVPSLNHIRRAKVGLRRLGSKTDLAAGQERPAFEAYPSRDRFFEYRMTPRQFERECLGAGFELVESRPIANIDGIYHMFGPLGRSVAVFERWEFQVGWMGRLIDASLGRIPFMVNHMHACVLRNPR
jgi:SAM-dependent methyltransferase